MYVCMSVRPSVCEQDISNSNWAIWLNIGGLSDGSRIFRLYFGGETVPDLDPGWFWRKQHVNIICGFSWSWLIHIAQGISYRQGIFGYIKLYSYTPTPSYIGTGMSGTSDLDNLSAMMGSCYGLVLPQRGHGSGSMNVGLFLSMHLPSLSLFKLSVLDHWS